MNLDFGFTADDWTAMALSLRVATVAVVMSLPFGIAVAYLLSRKEFYGKTLVNALVHLPLVMPPVVTGYLLLLTFGRRGTVGMLLDHWFGLVLSFRWTGAALAAAVMGFPLMVRSIRLSLDNVDLKLEAAASTLGASRPQVFLSVTLPLILPGIAAGVMVAFAKALGEFGATITFVSNIPGETQTLASAIYTYLQVPGGELAASRLTAVSIVISIGALVASEALGRRLQARAGGQ
ncbi:molybdate ABC transporter permease subunit [Rhizobium halophytocola]|uniref:Molybdenum transport system permease n=1 Tax=Rhizobium halophytocola TaxID=735519 RepID=A0ABS4DXF1_9HYPH|nr:molybdate ABC transporter permease subunit [Rhizobium halophytocola]MBP1850373.1 molybdate transport system permease protein [Rhizobium halophytocola]